MAKSSLQRNTKCLWTKLRLSYFFFSINFRISVSHSKVTLHLDSLSSAATELNVHTAWPGLEVSILSSSLMLMEWIEGKAEQGLRYLFCMDLAPDWSPALHTVPKYQWEWMRTQNQEAPPGVVSKWVNQNKKILKRTEIKTLSLSSMIRSLKQWAQTLKLLHFRIPHKDSASALRVLP